MSEGALQKVVERLFSHRPIREGLERILQAREGALIVLGTNPELAKVSVDGLLLDSVALDAPRLAEVAKMDGAIILNSSWTKILAANAHLAPPPNVPSNESGARHRTAQRVAQITGLAVVTVSKDRAVVTLYINAEQVDLTPRWTMGERIIQHLHFLFEMRDLFDQSDEQLLRMELLGLVTAREVGSVLRLGEILQRTASDIEAMLAETDQESAPTQTLVADRLLGVEGLMEMTLRDYFGDEADAVRQRLARMDTNRLSHNWVVVSDLGLDQLDDGVAPRGNRLLSQAGFPSVRLKRLVLDAFPDAQTMLHCSVKDFMKVKGIGIKSATRLRFAFDRLLSSVPPIGQGAVVSRH